MVSREWKNSEIYTTAAAEYGKLSILEGWVESGYDWSPNEVCDAAASGWRCKVLLWLQSKSSIDICSIVSEYENEELLEWCVENKPNGYERYGS